MNLLEFESFIGQVSPYIMFLFCFTTDYVSLNTIQHPKLFNWITKKYIIFNCILVQLPVPGLYVYSAAEYSLRLDLIAGQLYTAVHRTPGLFDWNRFISSVS